MNPPPPTGLPYTDTKPHGAPDFYYAINATFRFILRHFGEEGWRNYLGELGRGYYAPVNQAWQAGGLPAVAGYWRAFFAAEPGGEVEVVEKPDRVEVRVSRCPAIHHLRGGGREIVPQFCRHCHLLGSARAEAAGLAMRLEGGNGSCCHTYARPSANLPAQDPRDIKEATA